MAIEVNFDGIVGPTHNYSGLSFGNLASTHNKASISRPKNAALQGLAKMHALHRLGLAQAVLPPHERPFLPALRQAGFSGKDSDVVAKAARENFELLRVLSSAAAMWTANAATVIPASDSEDGRLHLFVANLREMPHRAVEANVTKRILDRIFDDPSSFKVHQALDPKNGFGDEGAANHTRFCKTYGEEGVHLFVYGKSQDPNEPAPLLHPARQTKSASAEISKCLRHPQMALLTQQNPKAIDAGAFHNDVVSVGNQNVFLYHEAAFSDPKLLDRLALRLEQHCHTTLLPICVESRSVSLDQAVQSYLFNSQLVSMPQGGMALIAPSTCEELAEVKSEIERIVADSSNPIQDVFYFNVHESMKNGGGPACLRLRVILSEAAYPKVNPSVFLTNETYATLVHWVNKHYRDTLAPKDLADPLLYAESCVALDELTQILKLGSVYDFQR